ncbi:uncharacterized protein MONBRDRAFT_33844 [Monosiga brevicollis MX1]|uniref:RCC1-like domain-containing protein n=1 Tax=Monosiga brevicollis TaxID=81824 RepID=A9V7W1_MONBE|nr:uncharacterized protein MONBRDRAFT_33844 [Monosiga brevicollis MX1]EDQ86374.1 predicted protein [Monosiga brevicollis MX1]|eukprot:XP_001748764.1 hypothetical protein [Monosiga brevicollis MX1]
MAPKRGATKTGGQPKAKKANQSTAKKTAPASAPAGIERQDIHDLTPANKGHCLAVGINCFGQLGVGDHITERKKPAFVRKGTLENVLVTDVAAGGMHTAVVDEQHRVHTFGCNDEGALGRPASSNEEESYPGLAQGLDDIKAIQVTAGDSHTAILGSDGYVYAVGVFRDDDGSLAFSPTSLIERQFCRVFPTDEMLKATQTRRRKLPLAKQISSGSDHLLILTTEGQVYSMGTGKQGQLGRLPEKKTTRDAYRSLGALPEEIKARRTTPEFLQQVLVPGLVRARGFKSIVKVFTGSWASFALDDEGHVWAWGLNNHHQLGVPRSEKASFGVDDNCVFFPQRATKFENLDISAIAGGQHHTLVCSEKQQKVFAIGRGDCGRLGLNNEEEMHELSEVTTLSNQNLTGVACAVAASYAFSNRGKAYAWGFGTNLQLTNGEDQDELVPIELSGQQLDTRAVAKISGGGQHTVMLAVPNDA